MFRRGNFGPGIIGVLTVHANDFYPPTQEDCKKVLDHKNYVPKVVSFPMDLVVLSEKRAEGRLYKQYITVKNRAQYDALVETVTQHGSMAPSDMLRPDADVSEGTILSDDRIQEISEM